MSNQYITNSDIYQVNAERDISVILSRFNTNYIYDCIDSALNNNLNSQFLIPNPNLVRSLEDTFKMMELDFPDDKANIQTCRLETYEEIIEYLCSKFNLTFTNNSDSVDLYSAAYYLYDFLVGNYLNNIVAFYGKFILNEKANIYKTFGLEKLKKATNINYGKKIIKDPMISTIIIQTPYNIDQHTAFDFDFDSIVRVIYDDNDIAKFIISLFDDSEYFYNYFKLYLGNGFIRPNIITNIRLFLQNNSLTEDITDTFIKERK